MSELTTNLYKVIAASDKPRVYEMFHASSIADCPRAHFYKLKGVEIVQKPAAGKMLRWLAGHLMEEAIRPHLLELYPDMISNVRLTSKSLGLTGEFDNYVPSLGRIIEVKSVHDFAIKIDKETKEARLRDNKPYLNHELQNHAYSILLGEEGTVVKEIEYLYITLGGLMASYLTEVQPKLVDNVKARLEVLNESLATNIPPKCICTDRHPLWATTMQYCDFRTKYDCCSIELFERIK